MLPGFDHPMCDDWYAEDDAAKHRSGECVIAIEGQSGDVACGQSAERVRVGSEAAPDCEIAQ